MGTGGQSTENLDGQERTSANTPTVSYARGQDLSDTFEGAGGIGGPLAGANTLRFSSKPWFQSEGLYCYGYRFYNPNLQRWINRDPILKNWGINLYRFAANEPINRRDPDGRIVGPTLIACGAIATGAGVWLGIKALKRMWDSARVAHSNTGPLSGSVREQTHSPRPQAGEDD